MNFIEAVKACVDGKKVFRCGTDKDLFFDSRGDIGFWRTGVNITFIVNTKDVIDAKYYVKEELKPCPFCGSDDIEERGEKETAFVVCGGCSASATLYLWNRRAP